MNMACSRWWAIDRVWARAVVRIFHRLKLIRPTDAVRQIVELAHVISDSWRHLHSCRRASSTRSQMELSPGCAIKQGDILYNPYPRAKSQPGSVQSLSHFWFRAERRPALAQAVMTPLICRSFSSSRALSEPIKPDFAQPVPHTSSFPPTL
jgi:hypothetical protein